RQIAQMMHYTAAGDPQLIGRYLTNFAAEAKVDELITVHPSPTIEERLRSVDLTADALDPVSV
ncbi:MAG: alkane 1-monooxygenase, partial [Actinomycetota bacterium]